MAALGNLCAEDAGKNARLWTLCGAPFADVAGHYSQNGQHQRAIELYTQALQYGDKLDWLQYRAWSYMQMNDWDPALTDVQNILAYSPNHSAAREMMARILSQQSSKG